jgi:hypothetical protein
MPIQIEDLPLSQFEILGVSKADILNLPPQTLNALLNGRRTSLMRFPNVKVSGLESPVALDAKMSIVLNSKNEPVLKIHPINQVAQNKFNLSDDEVNFLKNKEGEMITKKIKSTNGTSKELLITLDKTTNEYIAVNKESINAPDAINNIRLTENQKTDFKNGKSVKINGENFQLNPKNETGISSDSMKAPGLQFKHSSYSSNELLLDIALLASGLGGIVLLEHIINLVIHSKNSNQQSGDDINNRLYREAIGDAAKEIKKLKEEQKYTPASVREIITKHLQQMGINHTIDKTDLNNTQVGNNRQNITDSKNESSNTKQSVRNNERNGTGIRIK